MPIKKKILYISPSPRASVDLCEVASVLESRNADLSQIFFDIWAELSEEGINNCDPHLAKVDFPVIRFDGRTDSEEELLKILMNKINETKPNVIVLTFDIPGLYQNLIKASQEKNIKVIILNEDPLSVVHTGASDFVVDKKIVPFYGPAPESDSLLDHLRHAKNALRRKVNGTQPPHQIPLIKYRGQSTADYIGVTGQIDKNHLIQLGVPKEQIHIVGWPRANTNLNRFRLSKKQTLESLGLCPQDQYVVHVLQNFKQNNIPTHLDDFSAILKAAKAFSEIDPNLKHVISVHPASSIEEYRSKLNESEKGYVFVQNFEDHLALYKYSTSVVGFFSTALLEAMLVNKPILTLDYALKQNWYPFFVEYSSVVAVLSEISLTSQVKRIMLDSTLKTQLIENQNKLIEDLIDGPPFIASQKCADLILRACELEDLRTNIINETKENLEIAEEI